MGPEQTEQLDTYIPTDLIVSFLDVNIDGYFYSVLNNLLELKRCEDKIKPTYARRTIEAIDVILNRESLRIAWANKLVTYANKYDAKQFISEQDDEFITDFVNAIMESKSTSVLVKKLKDIKQRLQKVVSSNDTTYSVKLDTGETIPLGPTVLHSLDEERENEFTEKRMEYYGSSGLQPIDVIDEMSLNFSEGNVLKYLTRAGKKDSDTFLEDLNKAAWYIKHIINTPNALLFITVKHFKKLPDIVKDFVRQHSENENIELFLRIIASKYNEDETRAELMKLYSNVMRESLKHMKFYIRLPEIANGNKLYIWHAFDKNRVSFHDDIFHRYGLMRYEDLMKVSDFYKEYAYEDKSGKSYFDIIKDINDASS